MRSRCYLGKAYLCKTVHGGSPLDKNWEVPVRAAVVVRREPVHTFEGYCTGWPLVLAVSRDAGRPSGGQRWKTGVITARAIVCGSALAATAAASVHTSTSSRATSRACTAKTYRCTRSPRGG